MWSGGCSEWPGLPMDMPQNGRTAEAWEAVKAVEVWYDAGPERTGPRPTIVAERIGPGAACRADFDRISGTMGTEDST